MLLVKKIHNIKNSHFKRNPVAKVLRTSKFKKQVFKDKKKYNRKKVKKYF
jgi:hypothetical protein